MHARRTRRRRRFPIPCRCGAATSRVGCLLLAILCQAAPLSAQPQADSMLVATLVSPSEDYLAASSARLLGGTRGEAYLFEEDRGALSILWPDGRRRTFRLPTPAERPASLGPLLAAGLWGDALWLWYVGSEEIVLLPLDTTRPQILGINFPAPRAAGTFFVPRSILPDTSVIFEESGTAEGLPFLVADGRLVVRVFRAGTVEDTIAVLNNPRGLLQMITDDGRILTLEQPWAFRDMFAASASGAQIAVLHQTEEMGSEPPFFQVLQQWVPGGRALEVRVHYDAIPLTESHVDAYISRLLSSVLSTSVGSRDAARRSLGEALFRPAGIPPVSALLVSGGPLVWLRRSGEATEPRWSVMDGEQHLHDVRLPAGVRVQGISDRYLWASNSDGAGHVKIRAYRLVWTNASVR